MATMFRDRAMAAKSGSEALDQQIRVVPIRGWVALGLALVILAGAGVWLFAGRIVVMTGGPGTIANAPGNVVLTAPVAGTLVGDDVPIGARVEVGETLAVIESAVDGAEVPVRSNADGVVVGVGPGPGSRVALGEQIAVVASDSQAQVAFAFIPAADAGDVRAGQTAYLLPDYADPTEVGYIRGTVSTVSPLPVPVSRIAYVLGSQQDAEAAAAQGLVHEVTIALSADPSTPTGLVWTQPPGESRPIVSGTPAVASIVVDELPPYRAFFDE